MKSFFRLQSTRLQDNAQFIIILLPDLPSLLICELTQSFLFRDKCFLDLTKGWSLGNQCLWHYDIRWHQFHHYYTPNAAVINNFQMLQLSFLRDNLFLYSYIQCLGSKSLHSFLWYNLRWYNIMPNSSLFYSQFCYR